MVNTSKTLFLGATLTLGMGLTSSAYADNQPDMYVVMFRADWCPPCKVVEPRLKSALNSMHDQRIEYVEIDITNRGRSEVSAHRAFDRQIVSQYNQWYSITGFAAVIDADTKKTLGCINSDYDIQSMQMHLRNLKTYATTNQATMDITCPSARS